MVVVKIMTIMVWLRKRKLMRARKTFQIAKREADRSLPAGWTRKRFAEIMRIEANYEWKMRKEKNKKKKQHLDKRMKPRKESGMVMDIPVGDEELGED